MELRCLRSFFDSMKYNMDGRWIREERKQKNMNEIYEKLKSCVKAVQRKTDFQPQIALVLGSGLGDYADTIQIEQTVEYREIEGFPMSTVAGHKGRFVFGYVGNVPVVAMQGRVHYYEGYSMEDVVLPIRVMGMLGAKKVILTNAAGGVNFDYRPGDLMLITDHITTAVPSPLIGANIDQLGSRFPDMSEVYSRRMQAAVKEAAGMLSIPLKEGVYVQTTGPASGNPRPLIRMFPEVGSQRCPSGLSTGVRRSVRPGHVWGLGYLVAGFPCHPHHGSRGCGVGCGALYSEQQIPPRGGAGDRQPASGSRISGHIDYQSVYARMAINPYADYPFWCTSDALNAYLFPLPSGHPVCTDPAGNVVHSLPRLDIYPARSCQLYNGEAAMHIGSPHYDHGRRQRPVPETVRRPFPSGGISSGEQGRRRAPMIPPILELKFNQKACLTFEALLI